MKKFFVFIKVLVVFVWLIEFIRYVFTNYQSDSFMIGLAFAYVTLDLFVRFFSPNGEQSKGIESSESVEIKGN